MQDLKPLYDAVLSGDAKTARTFTEQALTAGVEPLKLVNEEHDRSVQRGGPCAKG